MHFTRLSRCRFPSVLAVVALTSALHFALPVRAQTTAGALDAGFGVGGINASLIDTVASQRDGKVLIGGISFSSINGVAVGNVARVNADGSTDPSFRLPNLESYSTRTDNIVSVINADYVPVVATVVAQADGKVLVGGNFYFVNGTSGVGGLLRFNTDGSVDTAFKPPRFAGTVYAVVPVADGSYLVGGDFTSIDSVPVAGVVRLKSNGRVDSNFKAAALSGVLDDTITRIPSVRTLAVQGDGKLIIGGIFTGVGGAAAPGLARLNNDGSLDGSYRVDARFNAPGSLRSRVSAVYTLAIQADGKTLVGGEVVNPDILPNGVNRFEVNGLYRFNNDGSLDATFNPGETGTNSVVNTLTLQPDGKILIGGSFSHYNGVLDADGVNYTGGVQAVGFARLLPDGTPDLAFDSSGGANSEVFSVALQGDGKLLLGGSFSAVDGVTVQRVVRINTTAGVPPAVTISVETTVGRALSMQPASKGVFTFSRSGGNLAAPLSIPFTLSGSAQTGSEYKVSGTIRGRLESFSRLGSIVIPANSTTATLKVKPFAGSAPARKRNVVLNLTAPVTSFSVENGTATIKIVDKSLP